MTGPRFEIRPLERWDKPPTEERRSSAQFRAKWSDTVDLLKSEVDYLGGTLIVVQVDAVAADIRRDGMLRAAARVNSPKVKVSFESKHGPLTYATDVYVRIQTSAMPGWQANVRAIALGLQALRAVDRYGITRSGEQYRGFTALSDKPAGHDDLTLDDARLIFADALRSEGAGADLTTVAGIRRAYRSASFKTHPDRGGSESVFKLITRARDVLLAAAR